MMNLLGIIFLIFAIIYIVTILIVKYLLKQINDDCVEETNSIVFENTEYQRELKYLKLLIKNLKGQQFNGNTNLALRKIEDEIVRFEKKKELAESYQTTN